MWYNIGHMMNNNSIEQPINSLDNVLERLPSSPNQESQTTPNTVEIVEGSVVREDVAREANLQPNPAPVDVKPVEVEKRKWDGHGHPLPSGDDGSFTSGDQAAGILQSKIEGIPVTQ